MNDLHSVQVARIKEKFLNGHEEKTRMQFILKLKSNIMKKNAIQFLILFFFVPLWCKANEYALNSPDQKISVVVRMGEYLSWEITKEGETILSDSRIAMEFSDGRKKPVVRRVSRAQNQEIITAVVPFKNRFVDNHYNELTLHFQQRYDVVFRAYNCGVAYRFMTNFSGSETEVISETIEFNFEYNHTLYWPIESSPTFQSHYENFYQILPVSNLGEDQYGSLPFLLQTPRGTNILITEADLWDYPNFFLFGTGTNTLKGAFPKAIRRSRFLGDRKEIITENAPYLAKTNGTRAYPWRVVAVASQDKDLLENELVYKLSSPNVLDNTKWIRPGKVAWDWWNANNIFGVDFESGINTDTYKYYIDFASAYNLEYIILDEGWSVSTMDLTHSVSEIDIEDLFDYAESKNVGIVLWVLWNALEKDIPGTLDRFAQWGAKGIKVDFMVRADQDMVNYYEEVSREAASRQLLVNFHGSYKPTGLHRKYPNVLTFEGVKGLENHKWSDEITPTHNMIIPFTRMVAGPVDYTPGAMINATAENFCIRYTQPMSQGTRAHQAAMYVMYESPMQMLADNPSNYLQEPYYTGFISRIPTVWEQTIAIDAKVGHYALIARNNEDKWYVGAMTNEKQRQLSFKADFLSEGQKYIMEYVADGPNAHKHASDHVMGTQIISPGETITVNMSKGGGWVAIISPLK